MQRRKEEEGDRERQREKAGEVIKAGYERPLLRPFDVPQKEWKVAESHRKSSRKNLHICLGFFKDHSNQITHKP